MSKTLYKCSSCNYQTVKWLGCCPECNEWDTLTEHTKNIPSKSPSGVARRTSAPTLTTLNEVESVAAERVLSGIDEWDRVAGGGIMPGSFLIITGDPGIGKSTLLLQLSHSLAAQKTVFYFSTEESLQQVKERARRLNCLENKLYFSDVADLATILATSQDNKPDIVIIDSIQNCYTGESTSFPGSASQLREVGFALMRMAKENNITVIVSGHINKDGNIARPKTLEHMVDGVFYLQGEDRMHIRVLRSVKNRFGNVNEIGFFEMVEHGLKEVPDINKQLLDDYTHSPGSSLVSIIEGSRPLILELQALTIESKMGIPQRIISGVDHKQVVLIAAILEKYLHVRLSSQDIFFKVSGGFTIKESSTDLGIALSLLSSYFQQPLPEKMLALGEINLTGHIKPVNHISSFVREAEKFGFKQIVVSKNQKLEKTSCMVKPLQSVYELLSFFSE
jgi:DNA repair protein RadA/Sms